MSEQRKLNDHIRKDNGSSPQAIGQLASIAAGLREVSYTPFTRPLDLIGLP